MTEFGEKTTVTCSPKLVLEFEEKIQKWVEQVIEAGQIDEHDTTLLARDLVGHLFVKDN